MTDDLPPLWPEGWWVEPCGTAPPPAPPPPPAQVRRRYWADDPDPPDAWVDGRRAYNVPISIDDYPEGASQCPDPT